MKTLGEPSADDYLSPQGRLLERKQQIRDAEQLLREKQLHCQQRAQLLHGKQAAVQAHGADLRANVVKFDLFLRELDAKRARATKKAADENRLRCAREEDASQMRDQLAEMRQAIATHRHDIEQLTPVQRYLEAVVEAGVGGDADYGEVRDILARHDTLTQTRRDLVVRAAQAHDRTDELRAHLQQLQQQRVDTQLAQNNEMVQLQARLERERVRVANLQDTWDRLRNSSTGKSLALGQLSIATQNLFQVVTKYRGGMGGGHHHGHHHGQQMHHRRETPSSAHSAPKSATPSGGVRNSEREVAVAPVVQLERVETFVLDLEDVVQKARQSMIKAARGKPASMALMQSNGGVDSTTTFNSSDDTAGLADLSQSLY